MSDPVVDPPAPPAIVKPAAQLSALAAAINAAHLAGESATRKGLEHFKTAGEALIKAKKQVWHGSWLMWIDVNCKCSKQSAARYMKIAAEWSKLLTVSNLTAAMSIMAAEHHDEQDGQKPPPEPPKEPDLQDETADEHNETKKLCRPCRTGTPKVGCKECSKLNTHTASPPATPPAAPVSPKPPEPMTDAEGEVVPEQAIPAFEMAKQITAMCRQHDSMIGSVEEIAKANGGRLIRFDSYKQQMRDAKGNLWANRATHVCPYCKGKKDDCTVCKGEGWVAKHIWSQSPGVRVDK